MRIFFYAFRQKNHIGIFHWCHKCLTPSESDNTTLYLLTLLDKKKKNRYPPTNHSHLTKPQPFIQSARSSVRLSANVSSAGARLFTTPRTYDQTYLPIYFVTSDSETREEK